LRNNDPFGSTSHNLETFLLAGFCMSDDWFARQQPREITLLSL
jgi:hypothetical protein